MIWFRTMWSKTLRDYRYAILGWGITCALYVLIDGALCHVERGRKGC
jgi:hypothetical protein